MVRSSPVLMKALAQSHQQGKVWLVTGCSSGLGLSLSKAILASGDKLIATVRKPLDFERFKGLDNTRVIQLDVTAPEDTIKEKVQQALNYFGKIDVLVNNAGYVSSGVWEEVSHDETVRQFETNFFGSLKMTRAVLPYMRAQQSGTIFFMSSIAGWLGAGAGGPYTSSKFALEGAVECLHKETRGLGINVHLLILGQFRTSILQENRKTSILNKGIPEYQTIKDEMASRHAETDGKQPGDPEMAAKRIVEVLSTKPPTGETWPLRIPFGSDAIQVIKQKCEDTLKDLEDWDVYASGTDFPDSGTVPSYIR